MIKIEHLSKIYNDKTKGLDDINLTLPNKGLIAIMGPSGCGKSTLLKCISGLLKFNGKIIIDSSHLHNLSSEDKERLRLERFGFIFQDYSLLNNETVERNISLPLNVLSNESRHVKNMKCKDALKLVNLDKTFLNKTVSKLSGGEKQRVAIARSMINSPRYLLCDEPTGALDSDNSIAIMELLKKVSTNHLVVIASHDKELINKFADIIYYLKDGKLVDKKEINHIMIDKSVTFMKTKNLKKKLTIPRLFLLKHSFLTIKNKSFRMSISTLITSLGLLAIGLSISISSIVSNSIKQSYSALIDEDQIIVSDKERINDQYITSASFNDVMDIAYKFPQYVKNVTPIYLTNFETFYVTENQFFINQNGIKKPIEGLTARSINEFRFLDECDDTFYPFKPSELNDNEVVCSLTIDNIDDICYALNIERSLTSLSNYLSYSSVPIVLETANDYWEYDDQHVFDLKAFSLSSNSYIYHYSKLFNETIFEGEMRMPTTNSFNAPLDYPFYLRKAYCVNVIDKDSFLKETLSDKRYSKYIFEISKNYYQQLFEDDNYEDINRLIVFDNPIKTTLNIENTKYLYKSSPDISNPIYGTNKGIVIYKDNLLMGFAGNMIISSSEEKISLTNEVNSFLNEDDSQNLILDDDVIMGCFYKIKSQGLTFDVDNKYDSLDYDHIVISSSIANKLYPNTSPINKKLYLSYANKQIALPNGNVKREFITKELIISDIKESLNFTIFHNSLWPILFFQTRLGISSFDLLIQNISFKNKGGENTLLKLQNDFPGYDISSPLNDINKSVDDICLYMQIALLVFSILCVIIAVLLLILTNYLFAKENKGDVRTANILGISKKESSKFISTNSYLLCGLSFVLSSIQLILLSFIITQSFDISSLNPISFITMFLVSFVIGIFTSVFIKKVSIKEIDNIN